jgi:hypothetical protein
MAYNQARRGFLARAAAPLVTFRYYIRALRRMAGVAKRGAEMNDGKEFAVTQASMFLDRFTFRRFLEDCYAENRRRMTEFEPDMIQPSFLPQLAGAALSALRLWSFRSKPQPVG